VSYLSISVSLPAHLQLSRHRAIKVRIASCQRHLWVQSGRVSSSYSTEVFIVPNLQAVRLFCLLCGVIAASLFSTPLFTSPVLSKGRVVLLLASADRETPVYGYLLWASSAVMWTSRDVLAGCLIPQAPLFSRFISLGSSNFFETLPPTPNIITQHQQLYQASAFATLSLISSCFS
jgi:hypothetical protein